MKTRPTGEYRGIRYQVLTAVSGPVTLSVEPYRGRRACYTPARTSFQSAEEARDYLRYWVDSMLEDDQ